MILFSMLNGLFFHQIHTVHTLHNLISDTHLLHTEIIRDTNDFEVQKREVQYLNIKCKFGALCRE